MKNKKTAYFMLPIVLAIWGVIGWKVYAAFGGNEKNNVAVTPPIEKINVQESKDTVKLIANYRDPFLDKMIDNSIPKKQKANPQIQIINQLIPLVQTIQWPTLAYHGLVKKSKAEKAVGFLSVNGKSFFIQGNQDIDVVKVGRLWKDSVEIFLGKEKRITRK
jgi:hypothetical protein